jgi:hypothetical protein
MHEVCSKMCGFSKIHSHVVKSILFYFFSILFYSFIFYSILFCSILFYSILFYSILFYSILFYSILFYLFYSILFYSILFYSILFYSILFYSIIFYSILFWQEVKCDKTSTSSQYSLASPLRGRGEGQPTMSSRDTSMEKLWGEVGGKGRH